MATADSCATRPQQVPEARRPLIALSPHAVLAAWLLSAAGGCLVDDPEAIELAGSAQEAQPAFVCAPAWDPSWLQGEGANRWWVEFYVDGDDVASVRLEVVGVGDVELTPEWGKWVGGSGFAIETGARVVLHATSISGQQALTNEFAYRVDEAPQTMCLGECVPSCAGKDCGGDGCGGSCGTCSSGESCEAGICEAQGCVVEWSVTWSQGRRASTTYVEYGATGESVTGAALEVAGGQRVMLALRRGKWTAGVAAPIASGTSVVLHATTAYGTTSSAAFPYLVQTQVTVEPCASECVPTCGSNVCGPDGCGGSCGSCGEGEVCDEGACEEPVCVPICGSDVCGPDGCGGSCGNCRAGEACDEGVCVEASCVPTWNPTWQQEPSNEWWAAYVIGGATIASARFEIVGGRSVDLAFEWGRWSGSLGGFVPAGTPIVLHATNSEGQTAKTLPFAYLAEEPRTDPCGTTGTTTCRPLQEGFVTIQFDDNSETQYTLARDLLLERGLVSSFVLNVQPFTGGWSGYLTLAQARTLVADGHEVVAHNVEHIPLSRLAPEEQAAQMSGSKSWLEENLNTPVHHYAAPNGEFDATGMELAKTYFDSYRGATGGMTYAGADPYALQSDVVFSSHSPSDVAALIDSAKAARGWRILIFHRFSTGAADDRFPPEYPIADFEQVLDHLVASGLDVVTVEEGLARIACTPSE